MDKRYGFTLLETIIAIEIFAIITLSVTTALVYASQASSRMSVKSELLENARIALDFMSTHIKTADNVELTLTPEGRMDNIKVIYKSTSGKPASHDFTYNIYARPGTTKYHRLDFGGNELASYIADIRIYVDGDLLKMQIITDTEVNHINASIKEPIILNTTIKLYNKL